MGRASVVEICWDIPFHLIDQFSGSRGSLDGCGMSAFSALKSACTASVPGIGSRLSWYVIFVNNQDNRCDRQSC
jgi:hypothetical protein